MCSPLLSKNRKHKPITIIAIKNYDPNPHPTLPYNPLPTIELIEIIFKKNSIFLNQQSAHACMTQFTA